MKISVKIKLKSKENKVEIKNNEYIVFTKELPIEGRANNAVIELLSEYFKVPKSNIKIISGHKSKNKIIEIYAYGEN